MSPVLVGVVSAIAMLVAHSPASATLAKAQVSGTLELKILEKGAGLTLVSSDLYEETLGGPDEGTFTVSSYTGASFVDGIMSAEAGNTVTVDGLGWSQAGRQTLAGLYPLKFTNSSNTRQFISVLGSGSVFALAFGGEVGGSRAYSTTGFTWYCTMCDTQFGGAGAESLLFAGGLYGLTPGEVSETASFSKQLDVNIDPGGSLELNALVNVSGLAFSYTGVVPEPATWAMLITGFGAVGVAARRRRAVVLSR